MKLISVIVPVYKVEKYLRECVDSILSNTYTNLEIILVDDGSPDTCPQICDEYAQMDSRIKVIHQENKGLCGARNAGLAVAKGEYIAFADSDDVVSPLLYEHLLFLLEANDADWAACEFTRREKALRKGKISEGSSCCILNGYEEQLSALTCAPSIRNKTWTSSYVWNKLYRKDRIIHQFRNGCYNIEDLQFNWEYMKKCSKLVISSLPLYYYRINDESITETYKNKKTDRIAERGISVSNVYYEIAEDVPSEYPDLKEYLLSRAAYVMHGALARICASADRKHYRDFCKKAGKYIRKHWKIIWHHKETYNMRVRLAIVLFVFFYPLWLVAIKFVKT